jgi:hypothetical protein
LVSGTPTVVSAATTYTVTVTDTNGATTTSTFSLTVKSAITASSVASTVLTVGHAATAFTPVTASGGTGTLTYSVSPALPAGLVYASTGLVSGMPTAVSAATTYTVTVTDSNGATGSSTFSLTVNATVMATTAVASTALTQNHASTAFVPVTASGGTSPLTYSISPALPAGLSFSSATGTVSGTPTAVKAATTYIVTVTDSNGATGSATFSLTVNAAVSATMAVASTTLVQNHTATAFVPVTGSGGTGTLTYSVSPALPTGLGFSSPTGSVSGTPTVMSTAAAYVVTVTDSNGATASATFSLTVNSLIATAIVVTSPNLTPSFGVSIVLTATVTPAPGGAPGSVSFYTGRTLLGAAALTTGGVATLSVMLPQGSDVITAVFSGSALYAGSTSSALSVSDLAGTSTTFSASPTTQLYNNPIVLTAQVTSPTAGTLTGTMSFLDGTTVIATVAVVTNGQASYSVTSLAQGSHSLTAVYSGDGNFQASTSTGTGTAITVGNINLALGGDNNKSVVPGGAVTYNFPLSPVVTSTFIYSVALTATGLPPGATYTFSPSTIPAGSGTLPVAFTVQTAKTTAMLHRAPGSSRSPWFALIFGLLLPLAGAKRFRARLTTLPRMLLLLFGGLSLGLVAGLGGCGSGGFLGSPPGQTSYTITISATSGTLVRTSTVQLNLE